MAQQIINVGTNPNDGTGDTLRGAFIKTDENFDDLYTNKQNTLISGTNIKTINSTSLLGSGNVSVQPTLVSGTNIKTINGNSILGSGDLIISGGITGSGTDNYIPRFNGTTALENSQIFDNGTSVLVGTTTPHIGGVKFVIYEPSTPTIVGYFQNNNAICYTGYHSSTTTLNAVRLGAQGNNLIFSVSTDGSPAERMRITSAGYVGIGTSSPSSNLHVNGSGDQILISGGTIQSLTSVAGGSMINYDDSISVWGLFSDVLTYNVTNEAFYLNSIIVNDTSNSVNFGAKKLPNATSFTTASNETLIGVYDDTTFDWETAIYAKRSLYCGSGFATTILTIAEPNSSIDLVAKIGYGSKFFIAKVSVMVDWDALTYTYKITNTNTTNFDDSDSININFEFAFAGAEFVVQINNTSGYDIYPNINANIL
jgi:hypothetical protein